MAPRGAEDAAGPGLPRVRAWLTLLFAAAAFLSAGGLLEYGAGSPDAGKTSAAGYWSAFFAFNATAFGGAALLGGLPALAVPSAKAVWIALLSLLYGLTFASWLAAQEMALLAALTAWSAKLPAQLPAGAAIVAGLLWGDLGTRALRR
jgi:hypothetical protein